MPGQSPSPCVTYFRSRSREPYHSELARSAQCTLDDELIEQGFEVVARYGDPEFAQPNHGWMEDRASWKLAVDEANEVCREQGSCTLVILRADGIGSGDPFLPAPSDMVLDENVRVQVCGFSLAADTSLSLEEAVCRFERYVLSVTDRDRSAGDIVVSPKQERLGELKFIHDPRTRSTSVYYCNPSDRPIELRWQQRRAEAGDSGCYSAGPQDWEQLRVAEGAGVYLATFVQGDDRVRQAKWRFKIGTGRQTRVGTILLGSDRIAPGSRHLDWLHYDPLPLRSADMGWLEAPALTTNRLILRNWEPGDLEAYERHCNTPGVMRWLGGVQSPEQLERDVEHFTALGLRGPTCWVVERRRDGAPLGYCGVAPAGKEAPSTAGEWELGCRLREDAWGKGYASEAGHEVLRFLFADRKAAKLVARLAEGDQLGRQFAERLGMEEDAQRCQGPRAGAEPLLRYEIDSRTYLRAAMNPTIV
jgi:RimJ/RimL family protein N-acetyltransferase